MSLITMHVYDITNTQYDAANAAISNLNRLTKDALGAGGIFHGAVEVNGEEWSYGFCERGSGVYCCRPRGNTGYTYRESVPLGVTALSPARVRSVLAVLQVQWPGDAYDLLARNCNHFCAQLAEQLGVAPPPPWVNRFATNADATVTALAQARDSTRQVVEDIGVAAKAATDWLLGGFQAAENDAEARGGRRRSAGEVAAGSSGGGEDAAADGEGANGSSRGEDTSENSTAEGGEGTAATTP